MNYNQIVDCKTIKETNNLTTGVNLAVIDFYQTLTKDKIASLNESNKNHLYKYLSPEDEHINFYLSHPNKDKRKLITKFRVSNHDLLIERERYKKPKEKKESVKNVKF